ASFSSEPFGTCSFDHISSGDRPVVSRCTIGEEDPAMALPNAETFAFNALDGVENQFTRYKGGEKGPVMVLHGAAVWSGMFLLPTIEEHFAAFLAKNGYDVWLLDWRASITLPIRQFTLDEAAEHDSTA